ncbi:MAG: outer membrane beta-barrel protein [Alphaproteobacteria bacterium]|nr:outer membrane beta-barrel protein [Alphaproteobacteria bacterium]
MASGQCSSRLLGGAVFALALLCGLNSPLGAQGLPASSGGAAVQPAGGEADRGGSGAVPPGGLAARALPPPVGLFDPRAVRPEGSALSRDGDLTPAVEADPLANDGVFTSAESPPVEDGLDPTRVDQRPTEERGTFDFPANPEQPADGNALLFQIEEIEPLDPTRNRRAEQFAALEPYDPLGIRIGSFVLFPEAEYAVVRFSNVFSSPDGQSDFAGELTPSARLVSDWSNHALEFSATGDLSNYSEFGSENDRGFSVETRGRVDITRRANLQASVRRDRSQEARSAVDATQLGERASITTDELAGSYNQRFNRLSVQLRGAIEDSDYAGADGGAAVVAGNGQTGAGGGLEAGVAGGRVQTASLNDRNVVEKTAGVRATWEFKPTLQFFVDVEGNDRNFEAVSSADQRLRNSQGRRWRAGVSFGDTSQILRGEFSLGYANQDLEDGRLEDAEGFILDGNLAWRLNGLTSLLLTASSDIASVTQTANSGAVLERRAGVEARHAFRRHLVGSIGIEGTRRDYAGIDVDESEFSFSMGLEYFLAREAVAFTRYEHTVFRSDFEGSDYESDEIRVGLRVRR